MRPVSRGDRGKEVVDVQTRLRALDLFSGRADGNFGPETELAVREFQQRRLLLADGVVGENTWTELVEAGYEVGDRLLYLRMPYMRGDDVLHLQRELNQLGFDSGPEDGIFGPMTESALTDFQRNAGINVDGIVGEATTAHLKRIRKAEAGERKKIPDRMNGYVRKSSLRDLKVSVDPAHGGKDVGARGVEGLLEKDVNLAVALELKRMLADKGADVFLVRDNDRSLGLYERAELCAGQQPDLHICVHHNHAASPLAQGAATYYFANGSYFSESGRRLAGYVVKSLVERLGRIDLHTHGRNYACLRECPSLALMVEPAFITHPEEGKSLASRDVIVREAGAIVSGVEAYLERR